MDLVIPKILILSTIVSFITCPLVISIYRRLGWIDDPCKSKHPKTIHKYPVPRGGGTPIFITIFFSSLFFLPLDKHLVGILIGSFLLMIIGIFDDIFDLNPYFRLTVGFLAALIVIGAGIGIPFITNPFGGIIKLNQPQISIFLFGKTRTIWILADLFAFFWITWCMNVVNIGAKGLDGQLPGVMVIAALTIGSQSLRFSADITQWPVITLALITAGAYLGFLPWNFYPQKIMPGYGAGSLGGYMLAVLSILSTTKVGTMMLVLGIPLIDVSYSVIRRVLQKKSPVWGDRGHFHHRLMDLGWGKRRIAIFYWLITAFLGGLALKLNSRYKFYTIILLTLFVGGILLWLNIFPSSLNQPDQGKS